MIAKEKSRGFDVLEFPKNFNRLRIQFFFRTLAFFYFLIFLILYFWGEKEITTVEVHRNIESDQKYSMPYVGCIATARVPSLYTLFSCQKNCTL